MIVEGMYPDEPPAYPDDSPPEDKDLTAKQLEIGAKDLVEKEVATGTKARHIEHDFTFYDRLHSTITYQTQGLTRLVFWQKKCFFLMTNTILNLRRLPILHLYNQLYKFNKGFARDDRGHMLGDKMSDYSLIPHDSLYKINIYGFRMWYEINEVWHFLVSTNLNRRCRFLGSSQYEVALGDHPVEKMSSKNIYQHILQMYNYLRARDFELLWTALVF